MGHTPTLEVILESGQRVFHILQSRTRLKVLVLRPQVDIGIGQEVFLLLCPNLVVVLWQHHVALYATAERDLCTDMNGQEEKQAKR